LSSNNNPVNWRDLLPECDVCDGSTPGIRPDCAPQFFKLPKGYIVVERCDQCDLYPNDLAAAKAYGTHARWYKVKDCPSQAICRPPKKVQRVGQ